VTGQGEEAATPEVVVLDVNETLSDLAPLAGVFESLGLPGPLAGTWFARVLRDGFALAVGGTSHSFAAIAEEVLRGLLQEAGHGGDPDEAVGRVLGSFRDLDVHPDVPDGIRALRARGLRLVTLSNGPADVAEQLLGRAGLRDAFERLLSVEDAGIWKPARAAYAHALEVCGIDPQQALLVAVHPWDVDGALRAGLRAAWINRSGAGYPAHFRAPDLAASSLVDLADRLR
jgi:2-haloacid dehalogenase